MKIITVNIHNQAITRIKTRIDTGLNESRSEVCREALIRFFKIHPKPETTDDMKITTINLPSDMIDELDNYLEGKSQASRSELIRIAIQEYLDELEAENQVKQKKERKFELPLEDLDIIRVGTKVYKIVPKNKKETEVKK